MKINSVLFHNLNSLKGEFKIDFTIPPFSDNGIFAIIGPTGAGKTTILDAICVAIYHSTPRLKKSVEEIMSRHTLNCSSEVEFEVKGIVYRSTFSLHYSSKGKLQAPKTELYDVTNDKIIETKKSQIAIKIVEITGLSFEQFTKSMLLAQGSFAAFLKSDEKDRASLLEKMTGTEIYAKISTRVYEKTKEKKDVWEEALKETKNMEMMTSSEIKEKKDEQLDLEKNRASFDSKQTEIQKGIDFYENIEELNNRMQKINEDFGNFANEKEEAKSKLLKLENFEKIAPLDGKYQIFKRLEKEIQDLDKEIALIKDSLPKLENNLENNNKIKIKTELELSKTVELYKDLKPKISEAIKLLEKEKNIADTLKNGNAKFVLKNEDLVKKDNLIAKIKKEIDELEDVKAKSEAYLDEKKDDVNLVKEAPVIKENLLNHQEKSVLISELEKNLLKNGKEFLDLSKNLEEINKQNKEKEDELNKNIKAKNEFEKTRNDLFENKSIEEWESVFDNLKQVIIDLENSKNILTDILAKNEEFNKNIIEIKTKERDLIVAKDDSLILEKECENLIIQKDLLQDNLRLQDKIKSFEEDRNDLEDGKPCPLCGSKSHPIFEIEEQNVGNIQKLKKMQKDLSKKNVLREEAKFLVIKLENEISGLQNLNKKLILEIENLTKQTAKYLDKFNLDKKPENLTIIEDLINVKKSDLENISKKIKNIRRVEKEITKLKDLISKLGMEKSAIFTKNEVLVNQIKNSEDIKNQIENSLKLEKSKKNELFGKLDVFCKRYNLNIEENFEILRENIDRRVRHFINVEKKLKEVNEEIVPYNESLIEQKSYKIALENELKESKKGINLFKDAIDKLKKEKYDLIGDENPAILQEKYENEINKLQNDIKTISEIFQISSEKLKIEKEKLQDRNNRSNAKNQEFEDKRQEFLLNLSDLKMNSIAEFEDNLIADDEKKSLNNLKKALEHKEISLNNKKSDIQKELIFYKDNPVTDIVKTDLEKEKDIIAKSLDENLKKQGEIKQILDSQNQIVLKYSKLIKEIEKYEKEYDKWKQMDNLIGQKDGAKFRNFAQGLTLENLIHLANKHLCKLNDRYVLKRDDNSNLEISIIDIYQANIERPVKNLSGGESFVISLALALGLSDLNSGKTIISSLFLDEGFGSLDEETLSTALSVLETLQVSGKTIGIISHVTALKEQITTQIQVSKIGNGISTLKIVS